MVAFSFRVKLIIKLPLFPQSPIDQCDLFRAGSFTPNDLSFVVENWSLLVGKLEDSLDPSLFQTDSHEDGTFSTLAKFVESLVGFVAFGKVLRNIAALSWLNHLLLKDIF